MCTPHECSVACKFTRRYQISWIWDDRWWWATKEALGTEPDPLARAVSALNHSCISRVLSVCLCIPGAENYRSKAEILTCPWPAGYLQLTETSSVDPETGGDTPVRGGEDRGTSWLPRGAAVGGRGSRIGEQFGHGLWEREVPGWQCGIWPEAIRAESSLTEYWTLFLGRHGLLTLGREGTNRPNKHSGVHVGKVMTWLLFYSGAKDDLELLFSCLYLTTAGTTATCHHACQAWHIFYMADKHSIN